jgi:multisubunit Na+/H+ antiporter MnhE subunit
LSAFLEDEGTMVFGVVVLMLVWLALTQTLAPQFVIPGGVCAVLVVMAWRVLAPSQVRSAHALIRHPLRFVRFIATLLRRFIVSTLHTSWLIVRGGEQGQLMALPLRVRDPLGTFILLNSITLTPSTIALLTEENLLYIHWLQPAKGRGDWREIKESLESRLRRLFDEVGGEHD